MDPKGTWAGEITGTLKVGDGMPTEITNGNQPEDNTIVWRRRSMDNGARFA